MLQQKSQELHTRDTPSTNQKIPNTEQAISRNPMRKGSIASNSLGSRFKSQLTNLINTLDSTKMHFIK